MKDFWFEDNSKNFWEYDQNLDCCFVDAYNKSPFGVIDDQTSLKRTLCRSSLPLLENCEYENTEDKNKESREAKQISVNHANSTVYSSFLNPPLYNLTHFSEPKNYENQMLSKDTWIQIRQEKSIIENTFSFSCTKIQNANDKESLINLSGATKRDELVHSNELSESISIIDNPSESNSSKSKIDNSWPKTNESILKRWNREKDKEAFKLLLLKLNQLHMDIHEFFGNSDQKLTDDKKKTILCETRLSVIEDILVALNWCNSPYYLFKRFKSLISKQIFSTRELIQLRKILRHQKITNNFDINEISLHFPGKFHESINEEVKRALKGRL